MTGMCTVSSLVGLRNTLHMPSSRLSRLAASSKRASAASQGLVSCSADSSVGIGKTSGYIMTVARGFPPLSTFVRGPNSRTLLMARNQLHRPLNLRIALGLHLVSLGDAQRLVEDLGLETVADEVEITRPFGQARLYAVLRQKRVKIIEQRRGDLECCRHRMLLRVIGGERSEGRRPLQRRFETRDFRRIDHFVRHNASAAANDASFVRAELGLRIRISRRRAQRELRRVERSL